MQGMSDKKILVICDSDEKYANRLAEYFSKQEEFPFALWYFSQIHALVNFMEENKRVESAKKALKIQDIESFLTQIKMSGVSSFQYLQNVYSNKDIMHQNVSVALAVSESILKENGVSRVHGGGFAGTIQAFVKNDFTDEYKRKMDYILLIM